jgi:hypothetical protein
MEAVFFFGLVAFCRGFGTGLLETDCGAGGSRMAEGEGILIVSMPEQRYHTFGSGKTERQGT